MSHSSTRTSTRTGRPPRPELHQDLARGPRQSGGKGLLAFLVLLLTSCKPNSAPPSRPEPAASHALPAARDDNAALGANHAQLAQSAKAFCGNCHAMPRADSFSREHWQREVQRGFDFYFASGRVDLPVPRVSDITRYFSDLAPAALVLPLPLPLDTEARDRFQSLSAQPRVGANRAMAGACVENVDWGGSIGERLMLADMQGGEVIAYSFDGDRFGEASVVAQLDNPCRLQACDLDGNGRTGLLVADLGSFLPADHRSGRVLWLRSLEATNLQCETVPILEGCGRVADARSADVDHDGDLDIVVADFGWHETGRLIWLERRKQGAAHLSSFVTHVVDSRPGTLQVPILDINGDGHLDIIALVAQEFESVVAYLNDGHGQFHSTTLFNAEDPAYGSSGIEMCDLDRDGDFDILYTNGDSFDSFEVKPYHALQWLENKGDLQFDRHHIAAVPGVHRAVPSDLDGDGDTDIVASAFLPQKLSKGFGDASPMAILWLENTGALNFRTRPLEVGTAVHPALCVTDFNHDQRPDLAAANFYEAEAEAEAEDEVAAKDDFEGVDKTKDTDAARQTSRAAATVLLAK